MAEETKASTVLTKAVLPISEEPKPVPAYFRNFVQLLKCMYGVPLHDTNQYSFLDPTIPSELVLQRSPPSFIHQGGLSHQTYFEGKRDPNEINENHKTKVVNLTVVEAYNGDVMPGHIQATLLGLSLMESIFIAFTHHPAFANETAMHRAHYWYGFVLKWVADGLIDESKTDPSGWGEKVLACATTLRDWVEGSYKEQKMEDLPSMEEELKDEHKLMIKSLYGVDLDKRFKGLNDADKAKQFNELLLGSYKKSVFQIARCIIGNMLREDMTLLGRKYYVVKRQESIPLHPSFEIALSGLQMACWYYGTDGCGMLVEELYDIYSIAFTLGQMHVGITARMGMIDKIKQAQKKGIALSDTIKDLHDRAAAEIRVTVDLREKGMEQLLQGDGDRIGVCAALSDLKYNEKQWNDLLQQPDWWDILLDRAQKKLDKRLRRLAGTRKDRIDVHKLAAGVTTREGVTK